MTEPTYRVIAQTPDGKIFFKGPYPTAYEAEWVAASFYAYETGTAVTVAEGNKIIDRFTID